MVSKWIGRATWGMFEPPRATCELALSGAAFPVLLATAPRGERHPVLVVPGVGAGPTWAAPLRTFTRALGYPTHGPRPFATKGGPGWVRERLIAQLEDLADRYGEPTSVVGWSVGGSNAREAAYARPDLVRQVITLGAPLTSGWFSRDHQEARESLKVPCTALYTRWDHIFPWRDCLQQDDPRAENVEIIASHLGMASNPLAWWIIADRLALPTDGWRRYRPEEVAP
ncbi:esterase/lipase family protein [Millisia brevis]|uniref:esterase/lipase family protein n=1 Tax=Millisia brevis TaxID=264148 RepID=UPI0012ED6702|nr:hypothetical protein [Millisia brevis]